MRKTKQILALGMSVAMVASMTACGNQQTSGDDGSTPAQSEDATDDEEVNSGWSNTGVTVESGKGIDFEDGLFGFLTMNTVVAGANEAEISVVDFNGSKAAKIEPADKSLIVSESDTTANPTPSATPYIAIDASTLLGDKLADVKGIQMDIAVEYTNGEFAAVSGSIYAGNNGTAESASWSVYLETSNPKTIKMDIANTTFEVGTSQVFMVSLATVAGTATELPTIYLDNIIFYDEAGNALEIADNTQEFDEEGLGKIDYSNAVVELQGEVQLSGVGGVTGTGWWPTATNSFTFFEEIAETQGYTYIDPSILQPGSVITIYFTPGDDVDQTWMMPYLRCQQWADLTVDGEVLATYDNPITFAATDFTPLLEKDDDGNILETSQINNSWNIVQIPYDDIAAATGDDEWPLHTQFMGVADMSAEMTINKVTVGYPLSGEVVNIPNASGTSSNWGQAVVLTTIKNDGGTFDPSVLTPGSQIVVEYSAENIDEEQVAPLELILQSWSGGEGWAKVAPYACSDTKAYFSYDDMVAACGYEYDQFGELLDALNVGDCNCNLTVLSVGYIAAEE